MLAYRMMCHFAPQEKSFVEKLKFFNFYWYWYLFRQEDYPHSLSMYCNPPMMNISLQEFETYAYERSKGIMAQH